MRRHALCLVLATACANRALPKDASVEETFPKQPAAATLLKELNVVTFNVYRQPAEKVIRGIRTDRALKYADLILLQEVHRDESVPTPCSAACALGKDLGFHTIYAPGHAQDKGTDGVAIIS